MRSKINTKNKLANLLFIGINRRITVSLLVILIGIFLLPLTAFLSTISEENIINITNNERQKNGLNDVTANQYLSMAAHNKALAIFKVQEFSHEISDKKFSAWIKETNYDYTFVGENLAIDFVTSEGAMSAWLKSETHKKNILNERFKEIGVAVVSGTFDGKISTLVVQIFATPSKSLVLNNTIPSADISSSKNIALSETKFYYTNENLLTHSSTLLINNHSPRNLYSDASFRDPGGLLAVTSSGFNKLLALSKTGAVKLVINKNINNSLMILLLYTLLLALGLPLIYLAIKLYPSNNYLPYKITTNNRNAKANR